MEHENTELVLATETTPNGLLALAVQKDLDIEKLTKLMELQERWQANEAKKAFVAAMTAFKQNPPKIIKDMHVEFVTSRGKTSYNHASLGNVVGSITEALSQQNMSVNWQTETKDLVSVTCTITHIAGHSESTTISAKPDESGGKNSIQAIGSTITYLQRYTLLAICGLATNENENDGRGAEPDKEPTKPPAKAINSNLKNLREVATAHKDKLPETMKSELRSIFDKKTEITNDELVTWLDKIKVEIGKVQQ